LLFNKSGEWPWKQVLVLVLVLVGEDCCWQKRLKWRAKPTTTTALSLKFTLTQVRVKSPHLT
jgi:hypothetical protein